jgi:hypothetical protein
MRRRYMFQPPSSLLRSLRLFQRQWQPIVLQQQPIAPPQEDED